MSCEYYYSAVCVAKDRKGREGALSFWGGTRVSLYQPFKPQYPQTNSPN